MANRPSKACAWPGCNRAARAGTLRCAAHTSAGHAPRPGYRALYNSRRWRRTSALELQRHPLCAECELAGRIEPATVRDHIVPHRGDLRLFWDPANRQSLCKRCHDRKTAAGG